MAKNIQSKNSMKNLPNWFKIPEKDYFWYILQGYEIIYDQENNKVLWLMDNKLHRLDGPAVIYSDGYQEWFVDDKLHRLDGPAAIYVYGSNGTQVWCVNDKRHRLDGPAIIYSDGTQMWFVDGKKYTEQEFNEKFAQLV